MAQCFLLSKLLGQSPVATPSHRDTLLHVKEVQTDYPHFLDIVILNSEFNSASAPCLRVADQLRLCRNILLKWKVMEKQLLYASSVVTRFHPNVIKCWLITPSAVTVVILCYNYTTMDIRNNKYKEQFDQVPMCSLNLLLNIVRVHCV